MNNSTISGNYKPGTKIEFGGWPFTDHVDPSIYKGKPAWPKISIVTPSFNQGAYIERTILSVLNQNYPNLEYFIFDGGSTDQTIEIIRKYESKITFWVSEKDNGQTDAINKGLAKSTGELFNWLNSDDYLLPETLFKIAKEWLISGSDIISGSAIFITEQNEFIRKWTAVFPRKNKFIDFVYPDRVTIAQPSTYICSDLIKRQGIFNPALNFVMDYEFYLRCFVKTRFSMKVTTLDDILSVIIAQPESKSKTVIHKFKWEWFKMLRHYSTAMPFFQRIWILNFIKRSEHKEQIQNRIIENGNSTLSLFKLFLRHPLLIFNRFYLGAIKRQILS